MVRARYVAGKISRLIPTAVDVAGIPDIVAVAIGNRPRHPWISVQVEMDIEFGLNRIGGCSQLNFTAPAPVEVMTGPDFGFTAAIRPPEYPDAAV